MEIENFKRAKEIEEQINEIDRQTPILQNRIRRYDDYLHLMDGRIPAPTYAGKPMKKVELKLNVDPIKIDTSDQFDMVEENKADFIIFLKKCQSNYKKLVERNLAQKEKLEEEFKQL